MCIRDRGTLNGFWLLDSATRDGAPTNTLAGLFLEISPDEITSNFGGDTLTSGYTYDEATRRIRHFIRDTFSYNIVNMSDSTLKINSTIRDYPFEFVFKRVQPDSL